MEKQEELCVKNIRVCKWVQDVKLKSLLTEIAQEEQHHYDMINQMLQGMEPT